MELLANNSFLHFPGKEITFRKMSKYNLFSNCAFDFYLSLRKNKPIIFFIEKIFYEVLKCINKKKKKKSFMK